MDQVEKTYTLTHADGTTDETVRMTEDVAMATNRYCAKQNNPWRYEETRDYTSHTEAINAATGYQPKTPGQMAYEEDCRRHPNFKPGHPRPSWAQLAEIYSPSACSAIRGSWERNPTAREWPAVTPNKLAGALETGQPFELVEGTRRMIVS